MTPVLKSLGPLIIASLLGSLALSAVTTISYSHEMPTSPAFNYATFTFWLKMGAHAAALFGVAATTQLYLLVRSKRDPLWLSLAESTAAVTLLILAALGSTDPRMSDLFLRAALMFVLPTVAIMSAAATERARRG